MRHILLADSRDRDFAAYPTPERYTLKLPTVYKNVSRVRLRGAEVPTSFYAFSTALGNVSIGASLCNSGGVQVGSVKTITIPDGNYDASVFSSTLQALLIAAFTGVTFTVNVDGTTGRLVTSVTSGSPQFAWVTAGSAYNNGAPVRWGLGYHMGLPIKAFVAGASVTSSSTIVLTACDYILLSINEVNGLADTGSSGGGINRAFAKFPLTGGNFQTLFCDDTTLSFNEATLNPPLRRLDRITVGWRYHGVDVPINFNGVDHSFTLDIEADP